MQTVDNFLSAEEFNDLESRILGDHIDWYWNDGITHEGDGLFQFTHTIFDAPKDQKSPLFYHCKSILNKLGGAVYRIKANLTIKTESHTYTGYHTDFTEEEFVGQTPTLASTFRVVQRDISMHRVSFRSSRSVRQCPRWCCTVGI